MSTTALAILWLLSLSAFLAIPVPCLVPIGEFFFDGLVKSAKGSRSELTTLEVSHECDSFCCKIQSVCYNFQK